MRNSIRILAMAVLMLSITDVKNNNMHFFLGLSCGLGLMYLTEIDVDWDRKIRLRDMSTFLQERHQISVFGKFCGFLSTLSFITYFAYIATSH